MIYRVWGDLTLSTDLSAYARLAYTCRHKSSIPTNCPAPNSNWPERVPSHGTKRQYDSDVNRNSNNMPQSQKSPPNEVFLYSHERLVDVAKKTIIVLAVVAVILVSVASAEIMSLMLEPVPHPYPGRTYGEINADAGSPILGDPSAPVTVVEFGDYQCHFCALWFHNTKPHIEEAYLDQGKAKLVFVDLAFLGRDSMKAAHASYCADDQDMYWPYHDMLYRSQADEIDGGWAALSNLRDFAVQLELDIDEFNECMASDKYGERIERNNRIAKEHGATSTPTFFIVGPGDQQVMIRGAQPFEVFEQTIDSLGGYT